MAAVAAARVVLVFIGVPSWTNEGAGG